MAITLFKNNKKTQNFVTATRKSTKIISVIGSEYGIIPYHLAMMLRGDIASDIAVLIIDNSRAQDLFDAVPTYKGIGSAETIPVISNRRFTPDAIKKFDYVVVYLGYNADEEYLSASNNIFILSDYTRVSQRFLKSLVLPEGSNVRFVFYNKIAGRVTESMLISEMDNYQLDKDAEVIITPLTEEDATGYISWLYSNGVYRLSAMSKDYRMTISTMRDDVAKERTAVQIEVSSQEA